MEEKNFNTVQKAVSGVNVMILCHFNQKHAMGLSFEVIVQNFLSGFGFYILSIIVFFRFYSLSHMG